MPDDHTFSADLVIVGGGPVGITIARHCAMPGRRILIVESGLESEDVAHNALLRNENVGEMNTEAQIKARTRHHEMVTEHWCQQDQPFGVACRGLGGSTQAWAGKSAPFDAIDFEARPWVPLSDWPVDHDEVEAYVKRAMAHLGLCPDPQPDRVQSAGLRSFYWQFARSRTRQVDVMRFGEDFLQNPPEYIDVLLDATVTHVGLEPDGKRFSHLDVSSLSGIRARITAPYCVLATNAIENPRLLLISNDVHPRGIGNTHDNVGRYLADHPYCTVGGFRPADASKPAERFGFFSLSHNRRSHMYLHGMALTPEIQRAEKLLNASIFFAPELAPDDPWEAFKRLIRLQSSDWGKDLLRVCRDFMMLVKALGVKAIQDRRVPAWLRDAIVNLAIRLHPNLVAAEFLSKSVPHKLAGLKINAISEQAPNRESRLTLSEHVDDLGMPRARIDWRFGELERTTLLRIAELTRNALVKIGMPEPILEGWVTERRIEDATIFDMAHPVGTTRMSRDPRYGVVDENCRIHGLENLYLSGGSVFPTTGHTNPTMMFVAFAIRLADHLSEIMQGSTGLAAAHLEDTVPDDLKLTA